MEGSTSLKTEAKSDPNRAPDLQNGTKSSSAPAETVSTVNEPPESKLKAQKSVRWSEQLVSEPNPNTSSSSASRESNPYVSRSSSPSLASSGSFKDKMDTMKNVLGRWGSNVKEAAKKAEDLAENTWQHFKTNPSLADAAMGRIIHSSKVLAEGGYEKIFLQTFQRIPGERLMDTYACYLSTSAGPVMGTLYVSTAKLAFCSDDPLPYKDEDQTEWSYYKVVIPLDQLKSVNRSSNRLNPAEKYIQIITINNNEFWYMGFLNYEEAVKLIQRALQSRDVQPV